MDTENKPNNPTAFPTLFYNQTTGEPSGHDAGMSLRDYFANSAMQGMFNDTVFKISDDVVKYGSKSRAEWFAEQAYNFADAMLKQREL